MKPHTKPISSPGRTEKFPPPLMRFLRNNAGSRSRGRSRSTTTIFPRKKNTAIETQEPSSPKVTCMGQVRVKRSTGKRVPSAADGAPTKCRCRWRVPHALFFSRLTKPSFCFPFQCKRVWPNWGFSRRDKRDSKVTETSPKTELNFRLRSNPNYDDSESENRATPSAFVSNTTTTPPRNALLLTRCRSAPYSYPRRLWNEEIEAENRVPDEKNIDPKFEAKLRFFKELEESLRERIMESEKAREDSDSARPLVLTRCKSEPARTTQKLASEMNGVSKTLGFARAIISHGL
ncbi:unnamed protein product [Sphenostylis stenocarpa]|uniref:Uncharacterized protein n=1 Tax=Sphenostylis stenocarpa TaxID=92480 RepID=A0AA86SW21_9FABA|nr:unnamed protein product [Sphenostylis stenocarpa]